MPRTVGGKPSLTSELGVKATLDGGADAEQAQREAFAGLIVAALAAGVPRRVTDFAAGAHERALECNVIALIDHRVGGVLERAPPSSYNAPTNTSGRRSVSCSMRFGAHGRRN